MSTAANPATSTDISRSVTVRASAERAFAVLADLAGWPAVLPHIGGSEVLYADGYQEEFTLRTSGGRVRGILYRRPPHELEFVALEPPRGLARMTGRFTLTEGEDGTTTVTAERGFAPARGGEAGSERLAEELGRRLTEDLESFRSAIENAGP
ncbi:SRPBCC family protein [Streptomyces sp. DSM 44917]|uniref:SRPBCC family protein n=1 Tax=Streptomyces boetiae TaxID=3075541 RepID=A0ABU2L4L0_9ACTN|nr:SRPBCC family protein [Streptomyces sp. DSM 44917]MDT0306496.1 SRPBCC family protein [Streptomyces sp. DSM 44917]